MKNRSAARIAWSFLSRHRARFVWALFWRAVFVIAPMQVPFFTGAIIDGLDQSHPGVSIYGVKLHHIDTQLVIAWGVVGLVGVAAVYGFSAYGQMIASHKLSRKFVCALRKKIIEKITRLGLDQHQHYGSGDLLDRALTDTANLKRFMERVYIQTLINVLRIAYPISMLLIMDPQLTFIALSILPPQLILTRYFQNKMHTATQESRQSHSDLTTAVKENLDGIETIKVLHAEELSVTRISQQAERVELDEMDASRYSAAVSGIVFLMTSIGVALTWWQGGLRVMNEQMTIGSLAIFTGLVAFAYQPFRQYTTMLATYRAGLVSLERIQDLLVSSITTDEIPGAQPLRIGDGQIKFQRVSFAYDRRAVLREIDLTIEPRQLTVIVGPSGSGKSSLLRLIARLYDPDEGEILIDGQDLRQLSFESLRSHVAVVPQQPILFSGTILENICIAMPDVSQSEVEQACQAACALEFIEQFEEGFATRLGRGGLSLSGGQAQRIAIARALIKRPRIVLMDEPTSALDRNSEFEVMNAMHRLREQTTLVVIGHRTNTIRQADRVVAMEAGRVVRQGRHRPSLAQPCPIEFEDLGITTASRAA